VVRPRPESGRGRRSWLALSEARVPFQGRCWRVFRGGAGSVRAALYFASPPPRLRPRALRGMPCVRQRRERPVFVRDPAFRFRVQQPMRSLGSSWGALILGGAAVGFDEGAKRSKAQAGPRLRPLEGIPLSISASARLFMAGRAMSGGPSSNPAAAAHERPPPTRGIRLGCGNWFRIEVLAGPGAGGALPAAPICR
jgi:hypothetical protein